MNSIVSTRVYKKVWRSCLHRWKRAHQQTTGPWNRYAQLQWFKELLNTNLLNKSIKLSALWSRVILRVRDNLITWWGRRRWPAVWLRENLCLLSPLPTDFRGPSVLSRGLIRSRHLSNGAQWKLMWPQRGKHYNPWVLLWAAQVLKTNTAGFLFLQKAGLLKVVRIDGWVDGR